MSDVKYSTINIEPDWINLASWHRLVLMEALRKARTVTPGHEKEWLDNALHVIIYASTLEGEGK